MKTLNGLNEPLRKLIKEDQRVRDPDQVEVFSRNTGSRKPSDFQRKNISRAHQFALHGKFFFLKILVPVCTISFPKNIFCGTGTPDIDKDYIFEIDRF